jgi:hypothetical protein
MSGRSGVMAATLIVLAAAAPALAQNPPVSVQVDAAASRRPISEQIYGLAYADAAALADLRTPLHRLGGNHTSRYNWQLNADNRGSDWYFQSIPYDSAVPGEAGDTFIGLSRAAGAEPMITVPMVGWAGKLGPGRTKLASFSIAKYGPQTGNDGQWFPDAGNGIRPGGAYVTGNDPRDANVPAGADFQQGWLTHIVGTWGPAGAGGLRYYILDNEHSIWHETHRDVHPVGATMDEVRDKMVELAARIKDLDGGAQVVGPEEFGWAGYLFSGYDLQQGAANGWTSFPDRAAHGGALYLPWLLGQMRQAEIAGGRRLLDVFTVHWYPQSGEFGGGTTDALQRLRNRSTRSLWDPSYVDESWIGETVALIPRLKTWVDDHYPGTPVGITEYNWGADSHINGATAQADVLGIFGREGLDLAARWTTPAASTPTYKAIKMYRNYDGAGSGFGETSVAAVAPDPDRLSAFAALRSGDGALTVMVVSKVLSGNTPLTLNLAGFSAEGTAEAWQLRSTNVIQRLADVPVAGGAIAASLPPQSITLFVVPPADLIFRDGLETGTLAAWSSSANDLDLTVTSAAALHGVHGLAARVDDTSGLFVQDDRPDAESGYRARFWLDPNGFDPGTAQGHMRTRVAIAFQENPSRRVITVVLRRAAGQYALMARVRRDDGTLSDTAWVNVSDAPHAVELSWRRAGAAGANDGTFQMWVDGALVADVAGLDTDGRRVDFVRLGAMSVKGGAAGTLYFDEFESRRRSYIGP